MLVNSLRVCESVCVCVCVCVLKTRSHSDSYMSGLKMTWPIKIFSHILKKNVKIYNTVLASRAVGVQAG